MKNINFCVDTFDGVSGDSKEFNTLNKALVYCNEVLQYYKQNNYKFEFIEAYSYDVDSGKCVEQLFFVNGINN